MSTITLTTESSLEEYSKRVQEKYLLFERKINKRHEAYSYDPFLKSATTSGLLDDLHRLVKVQRLINIALANPKLKIHVNLDERDIDLIHREELDED